MIITKTIRAPRSYSRRGWRLGRKLLRAPHKRRATLRSTCYYHCGGIWGVRAMAYRIYNNRGITKAIYPFNREITRCDLCAFRRGAQLIRGILRNPNKSTKCRSSRMRNRPRRQNAGNHLSPDATVGVSRPRLRRKRNL